MAGQETSDGLKWCLRALSSISFFIGVGFIVWACVLQNPPETALPVGLVVVGSIALFLALLGCASSFIGRSCLSVYLLIAFLLTLGELAIVVTLFTNLNGAIDDLVEYEAKQEKKAAKNKSKSRRLLQVPTDPAATATAAVSDVSDYQDTVTDALEIGRYIFLVAVLAQALVLMATIVMRVKNPYKDDFENYDSNAQAAQSAMAQIQLENLKSSVLRTSKSGSGNGSGDANFYTSSSKLYKNVTKKMSQKYGEFTQDAAFQSTKWWRKIPGFN